MRPNDNNVVIFLALLCRCRRVRLINSATDRFSSSASLPPPPCCFDVTYIDEINALMALSHGGAIVTIVASIVRTKFVKEFDQGTQSGRWSDDREVPALYTTVELMRMTASDGGDGGNGNKGGEEEEESDTTVVVGCALMMTNASFEVLSEVSVSPLASFFDPHTGQTDTNARVNISWRPARTVVAVSVLSVVPPGGRTTVCWRQRGS